MHGFELENGIIPFLSTQKEWHSLGTIKEKISLDDVVSVLNLDGWECIKLANHRPDGELIPDSFSLMRRDKSTGKTMVLHPYVLGSYQVVQYMDLIHNLTKYYAEGLFKIETAGVLGGGKQFFLLTDTELEVEVAPNDKVRHYTLFSLGHGSPRFIGTTPVRVVCKNTLDVATQMVFRGQNLRLGSFSTKIQSIQDVFQKSHLFFQGLALKYSGFEEMTLTKDQVRNLTCRLLNLPETEEDKNLPPDFHYITGLYESGTGMEELYSDDRDTGFRFLNAVTEAQKNMKNTPVKNFNNIYRTGGLKSLANNLLVNQLKVSKPNLYEDFARRGILAIR